MTHAVGEGNTSESNFVELCCILLHCCALKWKMGSHLYKVKRREKPDDSAI